MVLSEQEILDCSNENYACKGGQPSAVMDYVVDNYLSLEKDYPYISKKSSQCYKDYEKVPIEEEKGDEGRRLQGGSFKMGNQVLEQFNLKEFQKQKKEKAEKALNNKGQEKKIENQEKNA